MSLFCGKITEPRRRAHRAPTQSSHSPDTRRTEPRQNERTPSHRCAVLTVSKMAQSPRLASPVKPKPAEWVNLFDEAHQLGLPINICLEVEGDVLFRQDLNTFFLEHHRAQSGHHKTVSISPSTLGVALNDSSSSSSTLVAVLKTQISKRRGAINQVQRKLEAEQARAEMRERYRDVLPPSPDMGNKRQLDVEEEPADTSTPVATPPSAKKKKEGGWLDTVAGALKGMLSD